MASERTLLTSAHEPPFHLDMRAARLLAGDLVQDAMLHGASDATARVSENDEFLVHVRSTRPETLQHSHSQSVSLTVYNGTRQGSAQTSDLSAEALAATLDAAWHIAQHTGEDPGASPAETELLEIAPRDLDLFFPHALAMDDAIDLARRMESAATQSHPVGICANGARVHAMHSQLALATSRGFIGSYAQSSHSLECSAIASSGAERQEGGWAMSRRSLDELDSPEVIGAIAARRACAKLGARSLRTGKWPVLFEAAIAASLVASLVDAVSGSSLYRDQTFLPGSLGRSVLSDHLTLHEAPHELRGLASAPFDDEGVRASCRDVVLDGVLRGYFLSTYSARKLKMASTGNAGGAYNLRLQSSRTKSDDNFAAMLQRLGRGLVVTGFMGHGVNRVTGDYSRAVSGFWVEGGEIEHAVHEVTVAGNLRDILLDIVAVGADIHRAPISTGSVLVGALTVAGR